ncbi:hypothetical protein GOBAR_AA34790 [Gossypium barbadense]|uniref:Lariat debranching enzyme C-terminal domain-containing protein n=1 Tax=Gossypium barbadense TaxID=3634 RepID=A0A2P5W471_GOSBA|nr:hypothetical protein GOBAR_AA34790 [Gossypium barbadense]
MVGPVSSESEVILEILFRYYGGWAAPSIYFLGFAGVVKFGNICIGGLSGIHNEPHLHCKFTALVEHEEGGRVTKFFALDKCLPGHKFLQDLMRFNMMKNGWQ